ncbi:hypothetical protein ACFE04_015537 [Oxalis oulophora]
MASSMVAKGTTSCQLSRNKRKFRADPPLGDLNKFISSAQSEYPDYEFSAEKFEITPSHGHSSACDLCGINPEHSDGLKLDLGLSTAIVEVGSSETREDLDFEEFQNIDWSELTESELEEIVLQDLEASFKSAIKKLVSHGYSEEVATKAILRSGLCYGNKDTVSNIVENTLAFLRSGQDINHISRDHCFEDLQQLGKYLLAEQVCVLREVRPFFSTGDAMWSLLITDMNISNAFNVEEDSSPLKPEEKSSDLALANPFPQSSQLESLPAVDASNVAKSKNSHVFGELISDAMSDTVRKTFSVAGKSQSQTFEEKFVGSRKIHSITTKREYILRQKSSHLEKNYRSYGSKVSSRTAKLSGLGGYILEKKIKPVSGSATLKHASVRISKAVGVEVPRDNPGPTADTELSLSLPSANLPSGFSADPSDFSFAGIPYDKASGQWIPRDKKDETILKLVPKMRELQNQLQQWTEWANQKVMQAARRLGKDKVELKALRQEKDKIERLEKERQCLEENTVKKLFDLENALCKASEQVERTNASVRKLELENTVLRKEMEVSKLRAAESAANFEEVLMREKNTVMEVMSWEKQKIMFQEEVTNEKCRVAQLLQELDQAKALKEQFEARWQQEEKNKKDILTQAASLRKEREQIEASTKSKEDMIKSKAEITLQRYKTDIQKLEKEISQLILKKDSLKIAALRRGIDGSYADKLSDNNKTSSVHKISEMLTDLKGFSGISRDRECVMCLSEEMSVVFLPCAHQVVCKACNEQHEKQGMKECPSCRSPIQRRVSVRYASA